MPLIEKKEADAKNQKEMAAIEAVIADAAMEIPDAYVQTVQRQMDCSSNVSMKEWEPITRS